MGVHEGVAGATEPYSLSLFAIPPTRQETHKAANPVDRPAQGGRCRRWGEYSRDGTVQGLPFFELQHSRAGHVGYGPTQHRGISVMALSARSNCLGISIIWRKPHPMIPVSYLGVEHL
jgi:hypothetical protein